MTAGLLTRVQQAGVRPKVFYTNTSYEYWAFAASLIHTSVDGKADIAPESDTRIYHFAGSQHVPGPFPPAKLGTRYAVNCNDFHWMLRALLLAMQRWITAKGGPPASQYPRLASRTLVRKETLRFPKIPEAKVPGYAYEARRLDFGPAFQKSGIVSIEPPRLGRSYSSLVPQVDEDGNETGGVRTPFVEVPLGTYTGWNLRDAATGGARDSG